MVGACLERYDRIDVLHNDVDIAALGGPVEVSEEDWDRVFQVNVKSLFLTAKHVLPQMEQQGCGSSWRRTAAAASAAPGGGHARRRLARGAQPTRARRAHPRPGR